jgi:predicted site-specific integrase-resolvase
MTTAAILAVPKFSSGGVFVADLDVKEVADRLEVSMRTVTRYIELGYFPNAYKLNPFASRRAEWRIPQEDVDAFRGKRGGGANNQKDRLAA